MLLDVLCYWGLLCRFVLFDVDVSVLLVIVIVIQCEYSGVEINVVCGDFEEYLIEIFRGGWCLFVFLGFMIGNFMFGLCVQFLMVLVGVMWLGDSLLLGIDLVKDVVWLVCVYDDFGGVMVQFNCNVFVVINWEFEVDFDVDVFQYVVCWNSVEEWIEMWLCVDGCQWVWVGVLDLIVDFDVGEEMLIEVLCKFWL